MVPDELDGLLFFRVFNQLPINGIPPKGWGGSNNNDIVGRVPLYSLGYRHVGKRLYIDEDGQIHKKICYVKRLLDRIEGRIEDIFKRGFDGVKDHSISLYKSLIEKARLI